MGNKLKFVVFIVSLTLLAYIGSRFHIDYEGLRNYLSRQPLFYSGAVFIILYCLVTFFIWFSKDIFRFSAALLFGAYLSTLFVFIAEVINAFILFYFARFLGGGFAQKYLKEKYGRLEKKLARANFFCLLIFRAAPLLPFRFMDLACGLTAISLPRYIGAVILGSPLRIFWMQYILSGVGRAALTDPLKLSEYLIMNKGVFIYSFLYLILAIIAAIKITRKERV